MTQSKFDLQYIRVQNSTFYGITAFTTKHVSMSNNKNVNGSETIHRKYKHISKQNSKRLINLLLLSEGIFNNNIFKAVGFSLRLVRKFTNNFLDNFEEKIQNV